MKQNLRVSLGAVVLALATLAAMIFAWLNFVQRTQFDSPDDGVIWLDTTLGVQAQQVAENSPAARAGAAGLPRGLARRHHRRPDAARLRHRVPPAGRKLAVRAVSAILRPSTGRRTQGCSFTSAEW